MRLALMRETNYGKEEIGVVIAFTGDVHVG